MDRIRTYTELMQLPTFQERFNYLKLDGVIGMETFGTYSRRWMNQVFYQSPEWRHIKNQIIIRDGACDMALPEYQLINCRIYIHHMNPITEEDLINRTRFLTPDWIRTIRYRSPRWLSLFR